LSTKWRWAGACAIGTSHIKSGLTCQDRAACRDIETASGGVFVAVVSDGAGSAQKAAWGATIACTEFHRRAAAYLRSGGGLSDLDSDFIAEWLDAIRDKIGISAATAALRPRDYAATLVALLANNNQVLIVHIGDGAATVRDRQTQEWSVPSWPFHGEYASTTRFITDDPQPQFELVRVNSSIDRFAIFSDGVENLFLDQRQRCAPKAFFDRLLEPVALWQGQGRSRSLSKHLRNYLDGDKVCDATDDDKSLIIGARS
jgi:serine/threonine protein phosphatase PrpC